MDVQCWLTISIGSMTDVFSFKSQLTAVLTVSTGNFLDI